MVRLARKIMLNVWRLGLEMGGKRDFVVLGMEEWKEMGCCVIKRRMGNKRKRERRQTTAL